MSIASHITFVGPMVKLDPEVGAHVIFGVRPLLSEATGGVHVTIAVGFSWSVSLKISSGQDFIVGCSSSKMTTRFYVAAFSEHGHNIATWQS